LIIPERFFGTYVCDQLKTMQSSPSLMKLHLDRPKCSPAFIITGIYLALSTIWILWSDALAIQLANNNSTILMELQNQKGIAFVLISGILLFVISNGLYKRLRTANSSKTTLEHKFEALNAAARGGMIDYDFATKSATINKKMSFFFPSSSHILENFVEQFFERIHPEDRDRVVSEYETNLLSSQDMWTTEYRLLGSDQKYYTVLSSLFIIKQTETGTIERLIGEIQDITQLRTLQTDYLNQQLRHKQLLGSTIIKAQENERNRWAEELHDNVSQLLTVTNLYLSNTDVSTEKNISMIDLAKQMVKEAQQEIRLLSAAIKPPQFSLMTLQQSIEKLISNIHRVKQINIQLHTDEFHESKMKDEQMLMIYRIIQEQLNNIIKYAEAKDIEITLGLQKEQVQILIHDNGKGFDKQQVKAGLGFRNIQTRLLLFNGQMNVESSPGNGCSLSASFPVC
jgi:signal transduction histidine kinase